MPNIASHNATPLLDFIGNQAQSSLPAFNNQASQTSQSTFSSYLQETQKEPTPNSTARHEQLNNSQNTQQEQAKEEITNQPSTQKSAQTTSHKQPQEGSLDDLKKEQTAEAKQQASHTADLLDVIDTLDHQQHLSFLQMQHDALNNNQQLRSQHATVDATLKGSTALQQSDVDTMALALQIENDSNKTATLSGNASLLQDDSALLLQDDALLASQDLTTKQQQNNQGSSEKTTVSPTKNTLQNQQIFQQASLQNSPNLDASNKTQETFVANLENSADHQGKKITEKKLSETFDLQHSTVLDPQTSNSVAQAISLSHTAENTQNAPEKYLPGDHLTEKSSEGMNALNPSQAALSAPTLQPLNQPPATVDGLNNTPTVYPQVPLQEVSATLSRAVTEGQSSIRLDLNPPDLGQMHMTLQVRDGVLYIAVQQAEPQALSSLFSSQSDLRQQLQEQGLDFGGFQTDFNQSSQNRQEASGNEQQTFLPQQPLQAEALQQRLKTGRYINTVA